MRKPEVEGTAIPQQPVGIIGRHDTSSATPHFYVSLNEAKSYVRDEWAAWVIPDKLIRKTYLFEKPAEKRERHVILGTMDESWQIRESGHAGPLVMQMVTR